MSVFIKLTEKEINVLLESLQVDNHLHKDLISRLKKYAWKCDYKRIIKKFS